MHIKLSEDSHLTMNNEYGCKITQLALKGKTIIKQTEDEGFLNSGSYLMFPWVNRVEYNPYSQIVETKFTDGKGYPLHGLFMNTKRNVDVKNIEENNKIIKIIVSVKNTQQNPSIHNFIQTFTLTQNALQINFKVIPSQSDPNPYCFGYHPYFQLSKPISELKINTNLSYQFQLQEDLLVKWPHTKIEQKQDALINPKKQYDSLFKGQEALTFIELNDEENKLRIESGLKYWQIYTPEDGKRIAIEPMSFHANLYQEVNQSPQINDSLPKQGSIKISLY